MGYSSSDWEIVGATPASTAPQGFLENAKSSIVNSVEHPFDTLSNLASQTGEGVSSLNDLAGAVQGYEPISKERAIEALKFGGKTALATAGAGVAGPPGAAAGMLLFDKLNQLTGSDAPTNAQDDVNQLGANTGLALLLGGASKVAGKGIELASKIPAKTISIFSKIPTEDQALQQAFKASGEGDLTSLKTLQDEGIINPTLAESNKPFTQVKNALLGNDETPGAIEKTSQSIGKNLSDTSQTVSDIFPTRDNLDLDTSKMSESDATSALKAAQKNITQKALIKLFPSKADDIENLYSDYQGLWDKAKDGDISAANKYITLTNKIQNTKLTGSDMWDMRQFYDKKINWNSDEFKGQAPAWVQMRDSLQKNIVDLGGGEGGPVAESFGKLSNMLNIKDNVQKMADLETAGKTGGEPIGARALSIFSAPFRKGLLESSTAPEDLLKQAYGQSLRQKLSLWGNVPSIFSTNAGKIGGALTGMNAPISNKESSPQFSSSDWEIMDTPKKKDSLNIPTLLSAKRVSNDDKTPATSPFFLNNSNNMNKDEALSAIKADPYLHATALAESNLNPNAKNPESSASGIFQLTHKTAKSLDVADPFDVPQSLEGMQKLTKENKDKFGEDPFLLYSAHYLGAPLLSKLLKGEDLSKTEQTQVDYLKAHALPRFKKIYAQIQTNTNLG